MSFIFLRWASNRMLFESKPYFCSTVSTLQSTDSFSNLCRRECKNKLILAISAVVSGLDVALCGEQQNWRGVNTSLETVQQSQPKLSEDGSLVRDESLFIMYCRHWTPFCQVNHTSVGRLSDDCVQGRRGGAVGRASRRRGVLVLVYGGLVFQEVQT